MHRNGRARLLIAASALVASACSQVVELEAGDPVEFVVQPQTSLVYAADGELLVELHGEQDRQDVAIGEVAQPLVQAVVSIEDRRYFIHAGVDVPSIVRAAVRNVEAGGIEQGGSTITQQYVKNTMTGTARTMDRKLREAALAYQLEQRYSKDEILERYLNTVYFGRGAYGVYAAADAFFGKEADDLTLDEASLLAGLIQSPSRYDPYQNPRAATDRRRLVLDAMVATGQISRDEADAAAETPLQLAERGEDEIVEAPYFVDEVKRILQHDPDGRFTEALGETLDERVNALFTGGLRVFTTLDAEWQEDAERAVAEILTDDGDPSAAVVAIDPRSGAVRALVGGKDYYDPEDPQARFNLATQGARQPGSSFKPIVLAAALDRGVNLDRQFPGGACASFTRPDWQPCNYANTAFGPLTMREATVQSANTVYARLGVELGPDAIISTARTLGFTSELPRVHALALGVASVSPLEMAGAYATFANLGRYQQPYLIERIETADGEVLYEHDDPGHQALDEAVAYLITQTLQDVVRRGTGVRAKIDRPQAGKTGTAQENRDAWFVGYTPDVVAAVWVGFPEGQISMQPPTTRITVEGGRWPAQIWSAFAGAALAEVEPTSFGIPDVDLTLVEVDITRNCLPNPYTPPELIETRQYIAGTAPRERCKEPTGPPIDDVPNVTGLPLEVAQQLLTDRGFVLDLRPVASRIYPPGIVTAQRPTVGGTTRPEDGNAVVLWVSQNIRTRSIVPDVLGMDLDRAATLLEGGGWFPEWRAVCPLDGCPADAVPGTVWDQTPEPGTQERDHSVITLKVYPFGSSEGGPGG